MAEWETVVGIEVHAELDTENKMFCRCRAERGAEPNTLACPVCMGLPGSLPVVNGRAVELGILAGLAAHCDIAGESRFDRKNYFYPDLPKGYQITQFYRPLCTGGYVDFEFAGERRRVGITRIHLEEDAGKIVYEGGKTLVDLNRCGIPLVEIVSEPELRGADEAAAYLRALRGLIASSGASRCRMNLGEFRADVNVSVRPKGSEALGTRTEIKNLNSFAFAARAIESESARQIRVIESGGEVARETMRFDPETGMTSPMRAKEDSADYRYFPEPDLPPVFVTRELVESLKKTLPPPPDEVKPRAVSLGASEQVAETIASSPEASKLFSDASRLTDYAGIAASLLATDALALGGQDGELMLSAAQLAGISSLAGAGEITRSAAKSLVKELWGGGESAEDAAARLGLRVIRGGEELLELVRAAIESNPKAAADYRGGKKAALSAITGAVMRASRGRADPTAAAACAERELKKTGDAF